MLETHQSYLQKQMNIQKKDIESITKKKSFNVEFISYGEKNNQKVRQTILSLKEEVRNLRMDKAMLDRDNQFSKHGVIQVQNQIKIQERILNFICQKYKIPIPQNVKEIKESTNQEEKDNKLVDQPYIGAEHSADYPSYHQRSKSNPKCANRYENELQYGTNDKILRRDNLNTNREESSVGLPDEIDKPIQIATSDASADKRAAHDAMKKFLDNKQFQGLNPPQSIEIIESTGKPRSSSNNAHQVMDNLETCRTQDDRITIRNVNEPASKQLNPHDLDESCSRSYNFNNNCPPS